MPLVVSSTVRDKQYQRLLIERNREATQDYSLHTTGYAFDVLRRYRSRSQAQASSSRWTVCSRSNLIAWVREPAAIHITVSREAERLERLLR